MDYTAKVELQDRKGKTVRTGICGVNTVDDASVLQWRNNYYIFVGVSTDSVCIFQQSPDNKHVANLEDDWGQEHD